VLAFVDIEHSSVRNDPRRAPYHFRDYYQRAINIAQATGMVCHTVHYLDFSRNWLRENDIHAFFISGNTTDWEDYDLNEFEPVWDVIRTGEIPIMGFCGGHQSIALAFGAECGPLGPLEPGEVDPTPDFHPGMRKEKGYLKLDVLDTDHLLFAGCPEAGPVIMESHYWKIVSLPKDEWNVLATTLLDKYHVIQHRKLPIYSTQGHPEAYTDEYSDGKRLIRNFAIATGVISEQP
jgi:GMP synthase-like glutamine amidotransferase